MGLLSGSTPTKGEVGRQQAFKGSSHKFLNKSVRQRRLSLMGVV
jgi:hypothetical protein